MLKSPSNGHTASGIKGDDEIKRFLKFLLRVKCCTKGDEPLEGMYLYSAFRVHIQGFFVDFPHPQREMFLQLLLLFTICRGFACAVVSACTFGLSEMDAVCQNLPLFHGGQILHLLVHSSPFLDGT